MPKRIRLQDLLNPKKAEKYEKELTSYFEKGGTYQEMLGYDAGVMEAHYKIAYDLYREASYQKAAAAFSYLTTLNPYEYTYWMGLALSKQSDRHYEEAVVAYTVAGAVEPEEPLPYLHLAQCYFALQQKELVTENLKQAIKVAGKRPEHLEIKQKAEVLLKSV